jgi:Arc/MetJ-type ribon-helix-helix transcriptional regulator
LVFFNLRSFNVSEVIATNLQTWRQKARDGTISLEEMREAVAAIRKERIGASVASAASKERKTTAKEKAKPIDSGELLKQLGI